MAAHIMLSETALSPYFFRKVIKKPKPMKIMTWTSWNTETENPMLELGPSSRTWS